MISKKNKKKISLRKTLIISGLSLLCIGAIFAFIKTTPTDMFSSVLQLKTTQKTNKKPIVHTLENTCVDSDGGKNYDTKGTITTVISGNTRTETDSCNSNGTLREWFCGNPSESGGLLRSENYVTCPNGCSNGACNQNISVIKDLAVQGGYFLAENNKEATLSVEIKNIGNTSISTDGIGHSIFLDTEEIVLDGNNEYIFETTTTHITLQPNETYTIEATIQLLNDLNFTYDTQINIGVSTYPEIDTNPSNNSYTFHLTGDISATYSTGDETLYTGGGDIIIESIKLLPTNTPALHSNFSTNSFQVRVKNIGTAAIRLPMNNANNGAIQIPFICYFPGGGNGAVFSSVLSGNTLAANQSLVTNLTTISMSAIDMFGSPGEKSMICEIVTQQQQLPVNPTLTLDINNPSMIYETNGANNSYMHTYNVIGNTSPGDIIIEDMYITPNTNPTVQTNNNINKINLIIKNIGSGNINIPKLNGDYRFNLNCSYPEGGGGFLTTAVSGTKLETNQSVIVQLQEQGSDTFNWFSSLGEKFITCTITSQQQQGRQNPDPSNNAVLFESNGTNNSFTLNYDVIPGTGQAK